MLKRMSQQRNDQSSPIPDKLYFRIGEVAKLCKVEAYVLRFWETEFPQLRPHKSGTGQRLYRKRDVELALRIKRLLYSEGYTIAGARQVFAAEVREPQKKSQPELPLKRSTEVRSYRGAAEEAATGSERDSRYSVGSAVTARTRGKEQSGERIRHRPGLFDS